MPQVVAVQVTTTVVPFAIQALKWQSMQLILIRLLSLLHCRSLRDSELIRRRQVLLPRLNHDVTSDGLEFAKVCYADKPDMERGRLQSR